MDIKANIRYIAIILLSVLSVTSCAAGNTDNGSSLTTDDSTSVNGRPSSFSSDSVMLDYIQKVHFNYMWDGAETTSGLAPERIHLDGIYPQQDASVVTIGGSGFGIAGILVAINRGFITRTAGVKRLTKIV
ncbi:MAG: beta-glucosidase, partial [Bacteroidaceae bacterium]